jgi:hypothetical protein
MPRYAAIDIGSNSICTLAAKCSIRDGVVALALRSEFDTGLELWAGERAARIFTDVYKRKPTLTGAPR